MGEPAPLAQLSTNMHTAQPALRWKRGQVGGHWEAR